MIELIGTTETHKNEVVIRAKIPDLRYFNHFLDLSCAPDLLAAKVFPNAKEVTETMGAFQAILKYIQAQKRADLSNPNIVCLVPCDGSTPRTGAMIACRSRWHVLSIDPQVKPPGQEINRLRCLRMTTEEFCLSNETPLGDGPVVCVAVHPHVKIDQLVAICEKVTSGPYTIIAIPCCVAIEDHPKLKRIAEYDDWGIHSPKRRVLVFEAECF